jgi:hypothetical protein
LYLFIYIIMTMSLLDMTPIGVIVYAFGTPYSNTSNQWLVSEVRKIYMHFNSILMYTQNDIQFIGEGFQNLRDGITYFPQGAGEAAPPTLRIARGAAQWARGRVKKIIVVAAKPHLPRALRDTQNAFKEAVVNIPIEPWSDIAYTSYNTWFDPNGTQIRAASRKHWEGRERILRLMPYPLYRIVAK